MTQHKLSELNSKFKIALISGGRRVEAPLPPDFGFTVGSEYTTPFDVGSMSGGLQKLYAVGGISNPVGLRMRKMYANPEPTEISFEMEFAAYYSAKEEVAMPVITLMSMGLGREAKYADIEKTVRKMGSLAVKGADLFGYGSEAADDANNSANDAADSIADSKYADAGDRLMDLIGLIKAPEVVTIKFGEFMIIDSAYITSTGVQFSNVLDRDGYPMSAKVSVTCTLEVAPIADDILRMFNGIVGI